MTFIPITIGAIMAGWSGFFDPLLYVLTLAGAILAHAGANVVNDYYDTKYNVDSPESPTARYRPHPVFSGFMSLSDVGAFSAALFGSALAIGLYLTLASGPLLLVFIVLGLIMAVSYSGVPFKYKHRALGEPAVFMIWGPLMTLGSYYVQAGSISWTPALASVPVGLLVSAVLLANNIRDIEYDGRVGIKTIPIMVGKSVAIKLYSTLLLLPYIIVVVLTAIHVLPLWSIITLLMIPRALNLIKTFQREVPETADPQTAALTLSFGILLVVSLILHQVVPVL